MCVQKRLIFLTLFFASLFQYFEANSIWNERIFPDDFKLSPYHAQHTFENSRNEVTSDAKSNYVICQTNDCKNIAKEFLSTMNKSANPCENFYDYVCGGWNNNYDVIPPSLPLWSRHRMYDEMVHHRIKEILESEPRRKEILPVKQAKKWYQSCMDAEDLKRRGLKPIESVVMRAGGWPIAMDEDEWSEDQNAWQSINHYYALLTGSYTFFDIQAHSKSGKDAQFGDITIASTNLPLSQQLPDEYRNFLRNKYDKYIQLISKIAYIFAERSHANVSQEKIRNEAEKIVEFEKQIFQLTIKYGIRKRWTLEKFIEWYNDIANEENEISNDQINWRSLIQELFDTVNVKIHPSSNVTVKDLPFIRGFGKLLKSTPTRTVGLLTCFDSKNDCMHSTISWASVNYIHWNFVANMLAYTTEDMRNYLFQLYNQEIGIKERRPRWYECVSKMKMIHASSYVFVNKYFPTNTENAARKMIKNIQTELNNQIEKSNWLDEESKKLAKEKLNNMKMFVGHPDWYNDTKTVINYYKGLTIGTEYFDNALNYMRYERQKKLKLYSNHENLQDPWFLDPITVNAVYLFNKNSLNIPAVAFQPPLFTSQLPDNVNYGVVGVIVGHEMGHGFDDKGIKVGKDGKSTKISSDMLKNYYQRAVCFVDQYDRYYEKEKPSGTTPAPDVWPFAPKPAVMTRGENIADATGLQTVFEAYRKLKKPNGGLLRLPGLENFTDDQLFFISFGSMWCETATPEFKKVMSDNKNSHSPARMRVVGALSNTKGFAEVFDCPAGSPMNPADKCSIWRKLDAAGKLGTKKWHNIWEKLEYF